ncbi:hypothetical protein DID76_03905 [Candidatus Marinamargulisbacteria bacterium SCGC AG-414-C22]|nr:hypothetical protein DID76_03905 [Candidatus Marinamargulisbacteria bacterium SCGC AG-414-C22]
MGILLKMVSLSLDFVLSLGDATKSSYAMADSKKSTNGSIVPESPLMSSLVYLPSSLIVTFCGV